ncbi:MAG TPA: class I SAM-dependent methyltransferase [Candidatus Syntrophosphaera sp.]|jgi:2-polyprenyl-3-methyl-5-hydroxy-6-metoxy-1,4-benzoquinol methylase|nr:class I SAM-dependent methyltransferase [Candidatus Syntrophosphaera sp.]HQO67987.1 class I SAM-dependent methyltransferase [Candidatus Syntrophosphaera sp.]HQP26521.1 class I SAM-dependent methyltransferase [Candidatus Syntrophosphaera sp.]
MDYKEHYRQDALVFDYFRRERLTPGEIRRTQYTLSLCEIRPGMRVLDVGSGRGWFSLAAAKLGAEVTALDLSEENLDRIKRENPSIRTVCADACAIPDMGKFDLIVTLEVLEHLIEPELALRSILERLSLDGTLLVTVPYKEVIRYSLCIHCNKKTPMNAHLHSFDRESLSALLVKSGFRTKATKRFYHRALELFKINALCRRFPLGLWKILDRLAGISGDRYSYLAIKSCPGIQR